MELFNIANKLYNLITFHIIQEGNKVLVYGILLFTKVIRFVKMHLKIGFYNLITLVTQYKTSTSTLLPY